jgi:hypothetical protein
VTLTYKPRPFGQLGDRHLVSLAVDATQTVLRVETQYPDLGASASEFHYAVAHGDCCSESWWADILHGPSCYGARIYAVRELDLRELGSAFYEAVKTHPRLLDPTRTRQEYDQLYGYELRTARGDVTLAFRNSSNGYYGGWAEHLTADGLADLARWRNAPLEFTPITTDDWSS